MGKIFERGYKASREEKERQDKNRENLGKKLYRFFLKDDGEERTVRFLTEEPVNFYEHNIKRGDRYESICCTGDDCPLCADGDRPTYKGAYLIIDRTEYEYKDKNGKTQKGNNTVRLFVQGMKVISQLDRISEKYGLSNRDVNIIRLGKGTQTTYTIEKGDEEKISVAEVKQCLPEKLRDDYDGTIDSLMSMVEEQLLMTANPTSGVNDNDEDDSEDEDNSKIISYDEEEEAPAPKKLKSGKKNLFKKSSEASLKPRAKNLLRGE